MVQRTGNIYKYNSPLFNFVQSTVDEAERKGICKADKVYLVKFESDIVHSFL